MIDNTAWIGDDGTNGPDEDPTDNTGTDDTPIVTAPDLVISKDDGGITTLPNGSVAYTMNYANMGNIGSTGVVITEFLPAGSSFDAASSTAGWTETFAGSGIFEFTVGTLAAGDSGSVIFAVIVDDPLAAGLDQLDNTATIGDDGSKRRGREPAEQHGHRRHANRGRS